MAGLSASEGGIYGRFGYGVASLMRRVSIDTQGGAAARRGHAQAGESVRFLEADGGPGPSCRSCGSRCRGQTRGRDEPRAPAWWDMVFADQAKGSRRVLGRVPPRARGRLRHLPDPHAVERGSRRPTSSSVIELWPRTDGGPPRAVAHAPRDRPRRIDQVPPIGAARRRAAPRCSRTRGRSGPRASTTTSGCGPTARPSCSGPAPTAPRTGSCSRSRLRRDRCPLDPVGGRRRTGRRDRLPHATPGRSVLGPGRPRRHLPRWRSPLAAGPRPSHRRGHERGAATRRRLLRRRAAADLPKSVLTRHNAGRRNPRPPPRPDVEVRWIDAPVTAQRAVAPPRCGSSSGGVQVHYAGAGVNPPVGGAPLSDSRRATDVVGRGPGWVSARSQCGGCRGSGRWSRSHSPRRRSCSAPARRTLRTAILGLSKAVSLPPRTRWRR